MKFGINKIFFLCLLFFSQSVLLAHSENKIKTVPLINLEELSPTFEEDKNELEKIEDNSNSENYNSIDDTLISSDSDKVYINLRALDKITAKTSEIRLTTGEKKRFGSLEIQVLKCEMSEDKTTSDTLAYLQVKDLSAKDNNQVFLFNGWSFVSSPTLKSIDHPIYDLWVTSCENI